MNTKQKIALLLMAMTITSGVIGNLVSSTHLITRKVWKYHGSQVIATDKKIDLFPTYQQFVIRPEVSGTAYSTYATSVWFSLSTTAKLSVTVSSKCELKTPIVSASEQEKSGVSVSASAGIKTEREQGQSISIGYGNSNEATFSAKTIQLTVDVKASNWYLHNEHYDIWRVRWVDDGIDTSARPYHRVQLSYHIKNFEVVNYIGVTLEKDDYATVTTEPIYEYHPIFDVIIIGGQVKKVLVGYTKTLVGYRTVTTWHYDGPYGFAAKTYKETYEDKKNIADTWDAYVGSSVQYLYVKNKQSVFGALSITVSQSVDLGAGIGPTKVNVEVTGSITVEAKAGASTSEMYGFNPGWYDPNNSGPTYHLRIRELTFGSLWIQPY